MLKINSKVFSNAIRQVTRFEKSEGPFGEYFLLDPISAIRFSEISGAYYVDNSNSGYFTFKGLLKSVHSALNFKFVSGIFSNGTQMFAIDYFKNGYPYVFDGVKKLLIHEYRDFNSVLNLFDLIRYKSQPGEYLVALIDLQKRDYGMEYAMEYLAAVKLMDFGFVVETQSPLGHSTGTPDLVALDSILVGSCCQKGFGPVDLLFQSEFAHSHENIATSKVVPGKVVVCEAKVGKSSPVTQLNKYSETGFFDSGYALMPHGSGLNLEGYGSFELDERGFLENIPCSKNMHCDNENYADWYRNYLKLFTLGSFSTSEYGKLTASLVNSRNWQSDLVKIANGIELWR